MIGQTMLAMRLRIYLRREAYVWLSRRTEQDVLFGWIVSCDEDGNLLFKSDESSGSVRVSLANVDSCGMV